MITPHNILRHELIGLEVKVVECKNKASVGLEGRVVDETRNTLMIETPKGEKNVVKQECVFSFRIPSGERVKVDGKLLVARPEDRIKKKLPEW